MHASMPLHIRRDSEKLSLQPNEECHRNMKYICCSIYSPNSSKNMIYRLLYLILQKRKEASNACTLCYCSAVVGSIYKSFEDLICFTAGNNQIEQDLLNKVGGLTPDRVEV